MYSNLNSRQIKAIQTKKKIFDASMELVSEIGFENLTINKICKKSGVAVGTFYYYYKSLDFIIVEAYNEVDTYFAKLEEDGYFKGDYKEKIFKIIEEQVKYAIDQGLEITTQFYKSQITSGAEYFISMDRKLPELITKSVEEGQKNNCVTSELTSLEISNEILTITRGVIYSWCLEGGNFNPIIKADRIVKRYFKGIEI